MENIKTIVIVAIVSAIIGGLVVKTAHDTEQMESDYNQCLQENEMRVCNYMYFS